MTCLLNRWKMLSSVILWITWSPLRALMESIWPAERSMESSIFSISPLGNFSIRWKVNWAQMAKSKITTVDFRVKEEDLMQTDWFLSLQVTPCPSDLSHSPLTPSCWSQPLTTVTSKFMMCELSRKLLNKRTCVFQHESVIRCTQN